MQKAILTSSLHRLACEALVNAGAVACESLLADEDHKKISDVAFVDERVVFEVKTFTTDRSKDLAFRESHTAAIEKHLPGGLRSYDPDNAFKGLPEDIANVRTLEMGKRAKSNIQYADKQIAETALRLGWPDARGGLMFLVPAHFEMHPQLLARVALLRMGMTDFPRINAIMFVSVPTDGVSPKFMPAFVPCPRTALPSLPADMMQNIGLEWVKVFERESNSKVERIPGSEADIDRLYFSDHSDNNA